MIRGIRTLNLLHIVLFHCIWTGHSVCASASCVKCKLSISHLASKKTYSACFLHLPQPNSISWYFAWFLFSFLLDKIINYKITFIFIKHGKNKKYIALFPSL
ncbi:hypothetical protein GLYMA_13G101050v4 [Glycine max]|nr:hypothetical protein GLYMA_13G101050v4 [Glycine max]KAH1100714.1 hypothetical protein GYH30_035720 [Glycine max]